MGSTRKLGHIVPHLEQCANHSFSFTIGLGSFDSGETLSDVVFETGFYKLMSVVAFVFLAVVGVDVLDCIGALGDDLFQEFSR